MSDPVEPMIPLVRLESAKGVEPESLRDFLERPAFDAAAESAARTILDAIATEGDAAVVRYANQFDGTRLRTQDLTVRRNEWAVARKAVDREFKAAVREAHQRITAFARRGKREDWSMASPRGGTLGEQFVPFDRVGVYVPGGAAPLVSTVLMTVTLAREAGVPEIVVCTPCGRDGTVNPHVLYAMETAGATEVYRVGGAQAIGMMAYGTATVRKVQKIVGPGGTYVTAAKRQVYGQVALDQVAGPSEIAILADVTADPACVACDLLSQLEHGTGHEKALLVTDSLRLGQAVARAVIERTAGLSRREAILKVIPTGLMLVVVRTLDLGMDLCNRFAPEHLEIHVSEPRKWLRKVRAAGAIFVGHWSPEPAGDFVAGPSHVLPTGGSAARFSGLTVDDFRRRSSVIAFTRADLLDTLPVIEVFGRVEGLDAHALSARVRFERMS